jgi:hypothetical protein
MKKLDEITIFYDNRGLVCVYLNRYRILGRKPWAGCEYKTETREIDREDIAKALREPPYFVEQPSDNKKSHINRKA